jgi:Ca-activated chloride channel family protein
MPRFAFLLLLALSLAIAGCHVNAPPVDARAVTAQGTLNNRFVLADKSSPIVARLLIEARAVERATRPPVNLALVVDTSGSMEGRAIEDARAASKALLSALRPKDRIAVVVFGSTTDVLLPSTLLEDADVARLRARLDAMKALGTTDMTGGLRAGMDEVAKHFTAEGVNRVILLGDGDPNEAESVKRIAVDAGGRGISITALGLGPDFNETLMGAVAQASGGRFHYVADSTKVAAFFDAEIVRLNRAYAKNAVVQLVPGPGVHVTRVIGQGASGLSIPIGDISFGERREIIIKLDAPPHRAGASVELLDAVLRFEDVTAGVTVERRVFYGVHASGQEEEIRAGRDEAVDRAAAKAEAAAATLEAIEAARRGAVAKAQASLKSAPNAEHAYQFSDELVNALPSVAPSSPSQPIKPSQKKDSEVVRRAHDDAMKVLQTH